jgi:hypothetical protein
MHRVDLHIVRNARGWFLQNARGDQLSVWRDSDRALDAGHRKAQAWQRRGLNARVILHRPGKPPQVFDFPAEVAPDTRIESYALGWCGL